jgi:hypothetical protein
VEQAGISSLLSVLAHPMMCVGHVDRFGESNAKQSAGMVPVAFFVVRGSIMSKRLSAQDCHAVDLLLERSDKPMVETIFARPVRGKFEARLDSVEKILNLIDAMPAAEPPSDLVTRTMERIEASKLQNIARTQEKRADARTHL